MQNNSKTCVYAETFHTPVPVRCAGSSFIYRSHGWLCLNHYRIQQMRIPPAPRKSQPLWKGFAAMNMNDEQIVQDVIATDRKDIANSKITSVKFGSVEPIYLRYAERR